MLRVASFEISNDKGINELLSKYRLAAGAHILVSEGKLCIPYEDGEPKNAAQKVIDIKEQQQKCRDQIADIVHSQKVVDLQIADAEDNAKVAHAEWDKNRSNKILELRKNETEAAVNDAKRLKLQNAHEITRIQRNLDLYDLEIVELSNA